jgi:hypothetical protein
MEFEKLLKVGIKHFADYLEVLLYTLISPNLAFEPLESQKVGHILGLVPGTRRSRSKFNPKLLSYLVISIFIGSVLNGLVSGRRPAPEFVKVLLVVLGYWLIIGAATYVICRIFGGKGLFVSTISASLQVLATVYVFSSFGAFLWGVAVTGLDPLSSEPLILGALAESLLKEPIYIYIFFFFQAVLTSVYLPWIHLRLHTFRFSRRIWPPAKMNASFTLYFLENVLFFLIFACLVSVVVGVNNLNYRAHGVVFCEGKPDTSMLADNGPKTMRVVFVVQKVALPDRSN